MHSHFSDQGSNKTEVEELIMFNLEVLLQKTELGGKLQLFALELQINIQW